ncbi:MAG: MerR family DNA-binding transcriptional regulator, partial [Acetatifactor sp.]
MQGEELLDIAEVCELLDITSRTLRFYEEKGLIHST